MQDIYWSAIASIVYERAWHNAPEAFADAHLPGWEELLESEAKAIVEIVRIAASAVKN
jgi:hypothetical protein